MKVTIWSPDLMSRRHPLSSFRASCPISASADPVRRPQDDTGIKLPAIHKAKPYFFFLATLRVFLAVFFAAVFATFFTAFFAFFAFLAMLPSVRCEMA